MDNVNLKTFTVFGGLNGTLTTVTPGSAQLAGIFTYNQTYEILGFTSFVIGGYDGATSPILPPLGLLVYGTQQPSYRLPGAFQNTPGSALTNVILALQAQSVFQPAIFAGTDRVIGVATMSNTFAPGFSIKIPAGSPVCTYIRLSGPNLTDDMTMATTLYCNVLPNG